MFLHLFLILVLDDLSEGEEGVLNDLSEGDEGVVTLYLILVILGVIL